MRKIRGNREVLAVEQLQERGVLDVLIRAIVCEDARRIRRAQQRIVDRVCSLTIPDSILIDMAEHPILSVQNKAFEIIESLPTHRIELLRRVALRGRSASALAVAILLLSRHDETSYLIGQCARWMKHDCSDVRRSAADCVVSLIGRNGRSLRSLALLALRDECEIVRVESALGLYDHAGVIGRTAIGVLRSACRSGNFAIIWQIFSAVLADPLLCSVLSSVRAEMLNMKNAAAWERESILAAFRGGFSGGIATERLCHVMLSASSALDRRWALDIMRECRTALEAVTTSLRGKAMYCDGVKLGRLRKALARLAAMKSGLRRKD